MKKYQDWPVFRRVILLFIVFGPSAVSSLAAQGVSNSVKEPITVHGVVLNRITHEPVSRALVYSDDNLYAALTDHQGRFQFTFSTKKSEASEDAGTSGESPTGRDAILQTFLKSAVTALHVRKPGYVSTDESTQAVFSDPQESELTLMLDPEGQIVGHVSFSSSDYTERIHIQLLRREIGNGHERWVYAEPFTTWVDGGFRFYDLAPGFYKLVSLEQLDRDPVIINPTGQMFGYQANFYPNAGDIDAAATIQIQAGTTFQANMSLVRLEYYPVRIGVANASAGSSLDVQVYPRNHPGPGYILRYNPSEQLLQGLLPKGRYTLHVSTTPINTSCGSLDFSVEGTPVLTPVVTLQPNLTLAINVKDEFTAARTPSASLPGARQDAVNIRGAGQPSGVSVSLTSADSYGATNDRISRPAGHGDDHAYAIDNLPPGNYWVHVSSMQGFVSSVARGGVDLSHQQLVVSAGESDIPIEVTLRDDGAEVSGSVQRTTSKRNLPRALDEYLPSPAYVYFIPTGDGLGQFREAEVDDNRSFREEQLPPGTYRILAFDREQKELEIGGAELLRKYESKGQIVTVSYGQKLALPSALVPLSE